MQVPSSRSAAALAALLFVGIAGGLLYFVSVGRRAESGLRITGRALPAATTTAAAPSPPTSAEKSSPGGEAPAEIAVHIAGAVMKPGVYRLKPGARNEDALKAAGGAKAQANLDAVNLAAKVEDGAQLYFPTKEEQPGGAVDSASSGVGSFGKGASNPSSPASAAAGGKFTTPGQGTININSAGEADLQRLPGIGPATAARILAHRKQNGPFTAPEQLTDVSGIGEKKLAAMLPFVRVK